MITSWACLLVLVRLCHVICWLTIQHFGLFHYILPQDPQGWHWSNKPVQRTLLCKLTGNFISTYSRMSGYQKSPKEVGLYQGISSPNDYHVLPALKQKLGSHKFKNDCEVKQLWHNGWQHRTWISTGNRRACFEVWCLRCSQDYMEKQWDTSTIKSELFLSQPKICAQ